MHNFFLNFYVCARNHFLSNTQNQYDTNSGKSIVFFLYIFYCNRCHNYSKKKIEERCRARCVLVDGIVKALTGGQHNHAPHTEKILKIQKRSDPLNEVPAVQTVNKYEYWTMENLSEAEFCDEDHMII